MRDDRFDPTAMAPAGSHPVRLAVRQGGQAAPMGFGVRARAPGGSAEHPLLLGEETHVMTLAPTGAGKTVSCTVPVLLQYPGPIVIFDCKGENAEVTARHRRQMGQEVLVVDPLRVTRFTPARFNPLDIVEPDALDAPEEARSLAEALLPDRYDTRDAFWRSRATHFLTAGMLHAVHDLPHGQRNLVALRDVVHRLGRSISRGNLGGPRPTEITSRHPEVKRISEVMDFGSTDTLGGMLHFAMDGVGFIRGPLIEDSLSGSDVSLSAITEGEPLTIYLVLPPHLLQTHQALLRTWFGALFAALYRRRTRPALPTLLILDEAAQLGTFDPLRTAITLLRGFGVQTWSFWQDPSQITRLYADHRTLVNNCGLIEAFGAKGRAAWTQIGDFLGEDISRFGEIGPQAMLVQQNGNLEVVRRIDYRTDPALRPLADPNPIYATASGSVRRPAPSLPPAADPHVEGQAPGTLFQYVTEME